MKRNERLVEVVYTHDELDKKVEDLRRQGYNESDLHIMASNESKLTDRLSDGTTRFKSFYTDSDLNENRLRELNLTETDEGKFKDGFSRGGAVIYADHDVPRRDRVNDTGTTIGDKFDDGRIIAAGTNFEESDDAGQDDNVTERIVISPADNRSETRRVEDDASRRTHEAERTQNDSRYVDDRYIEGRHIGDDDIHGRNTAYTLFDRHEERGDDLRHPDERIIDKDVQKGESHVHEPGAPIHPTSSEKDVEPESRARTNHEPPMARRTEEEAERHRDHPYEDRNDGVNRSDDEFSPGNDPNLGPAPFGRGSEEQRLAETKKKKRVVTDKRERGIHDDDLSVDERDRNIRNDDLPPSSRPF